MVHVLVLWTTCWASPCLTSGLLSGMSSSTGPVASTDLWVCPWSSQEVRMCGTDMLSTRCCDAMILPFVDLLISCCNLEFCNPREQATHITGGGLEIVFTSSCAVPITVHSGNQCCGVAPGCCPLPGSDHFFCVAHSIPLHVSHARCGHRPLPLLRDWKNSLLRAHEDLLIGLRPWMTSSSV